MVGKAVGALAVVLGTVIVGFSPERWNLDEVFLALPRGHGLHVHDLMGLAIVVAGIVILWTADDPVET